MNQKLATIPRWLSIYWWVAVLIPVAFLSAMIIRWGVHVPFWDQWEMVPLFQKHAAGTLHFSDFWMQHNEHRILFPNLIMYGLAQLTHWDPYYEVMVNLVLGLGVIAAAIQLLKRSISSRLVYIVSSVFAAWLLLSPIQWENWLWGWQIEWFLSVLAVLIVLWCLSAKKITMPLFLVALTAATIATYSLANGLVILGLGLIMLGIRRVKWSWVAAWGVVTLTEIYLYYLHYINPPYHPSKTLWLHEPRAFIHYVLSYLGSPLSPRYEQSHWIGLALLAVLAASTIYLWRHKRQLLTGQLLPWFALAAYGAASGVLTAISRVGLGVEQSYSSRYTTISNVFVLGTFVITLSALHVFVRASKPFRQQRRIVAGFFVGVMFSLCFAIYAKGVVLMHRQHRHLVEVRHCLQIVASPKESCLLSAYPSAPVVWERLEFLRAKGWGGL